MDNFIEKGWDDLVVCKSLKPELCGTIIKMNQEEILVKFTPNEQMVGDENNLIHSGFVFNAANYTAMCLVNHPNSLTIGAEVQFLAPIELEQEMLFVGTIKHVNDRKYKILIKGTLLDIKIFEGIFHISIFDKELFRLDFGE